MLYRADQADVLRYPMTESLVLESDRIKEEKSYGIMF